MAASTTKTVSLSKAKQLMVWPLQQRHPIMIHGFHGTGKSESVYQLSKDMVHILGLTEKYGEDFVYPVVERRISQMADAGDLMGMPEVRKHEEHDCPGTELIPMNWFIDPCKSPVILLLDEADRGVQGVRQAVMQLTDSRRLGDMTLHEDTVIFACVNGGPHDVHNSYQVNSFDPAEYSRWTHFFVQPTVEEWVEYSRKAGQFDEMFLKFFEESHGHVEHTEAFEADKVYPCRRSWTRFYSAVKGTGLLKRSGDGWAGVHPDLMLVAESYVGSEAAVAISKWIKEYESVLTLSDILKGDRKAEWSKIKTPDCTSMIDQISNISRNISPVEARNLIEFALNCPKELIMKFWCSCTANEFVEPVVMDRWTETFTHPKTGEEVVWCQFFSECIP